MVTILQNAIPPNVVGVPEELYYRASDQNYWIANVDIGFQLKIGRSVIKHSIGFDTFFGCFSATTWCSTVGIGEISIVAVCQGNATIKIWHANGVEPRRLLRVEEVQGTSEISHSMRLVNLKGSQGIIYPEFIVDDDFRILKLYYATEVMPLTEVRLAIVMPTFGREVYVRNNVEMLRARLLNNCNGKYKLFVIDNAGTLDIASDVNVKLVKNKNYGGAGGFSRGVIEAVDSADDFTHVLFTDDDLLIEPESIYRASLLASYLNGNYIIPGGMINFGDRGRLHEIGARVKGFAFRSVKGRLDLCSQQNVIAYDHVEQATFYGWWFVLYPIELLRKVMPAPFFVGWDDVQHGRSTMADAQPVTLAGVAVWHEEFSKKDVNWRWYYDARNGLISNFLAGTINIKEIWDRIYACLLVYRYERAKFLIRGIQDALKGPEFLKTLYPDQFHAELVNSQKVRVQPIFSHRFSTDRFNRQLRRRPDRELLSRLTLNGHLLPDWFLREKVRSFGSSPVIERLHSTRRLAVFGEKQVIYFDGTTNTGMICEYDRQAFFRGLSALVIVLLRLALKRKRISREWKQGFSELTTENFWRIYLSK